MSDETLKVDDLLPEFKQRLRMHLLEHTPPTNTFDSIVAVVDVLRSASDGVATREDAIDAAAGMVSRFPEVKRGSLAERLRTGTRLLKSSPADIDLGELGLSVAELSTAFVVNRADTTEIRWRIAAGVMGLAHRLPVGSGAGAEAGQPVDAAPGDPATAIESIQRLAAELPTMMRAAADDLLRDGAPPDGTLADQVDELRALIAEAAPADEGPVTVPAAIAHLQSQLATSDPTMRWAQDLASVAGPSAVSDLVARLHELARDVLDADEIDQSDRELVEVLRAVLVSDPDAAPDYDALERIDGSLRTRGINPLKLMRHLRELSVATADREPTGAEQFRGPPPTALRVFTGADDDVTGDDRPPVAEAGAASDDPPGAADAEDAAPPDASTAADGTGGAAAPVGWDEPERDEDADASAETELPQTSPTGGERADDSAFSDADDEVTKVARDQPPSREPLEVEVEPDLTPIADGDAVPQPGTPRPLAVAPPARSEEPVARKHTATPDVEQLPPAIDADALARLIEREPMMAALMVRAAGGAEDFAAALEALALSRALGDRDGATAEELDRLLVGQQERSHGSHHDGALLAAAGIGLALYAPDRSTLRVLNQPPSTLSYSQAIVSALQQIFAGVTGRALSREHVDAAVRQANAEQELADILAEAHAMLRELPKRESRHLPAKRVWRELISARGELGRQLRAISENTAELDDVQNLLADWSNFDSRLNRVAADLGARKQIVSGVRSWLSGLVREVLDLAGRWVRTTLELQTGGEGHRGSGRQAASVEQRRQLAAAVDAASHELDAQIASSDVLEAACLGALRARLHETRAAIGGAWRTAPDVPPWVIRMAPAARAWGVELDEDGRPAGDAQLVVEELGRAVDRDPADAVRRQMDGGNFEAADAALRMLNAMAPSSAVEGLEERLRVARRDGARRIEHRARDLGAHAARLLRFGIIDAARHAQIAGTLELRRLEERGRLDLRERELAMLERQLREAESSRLAELDHKLATVVVADEDRARIQEMLDRGDFPIAEDFLLRVERGEPLTISERPLLLEQFVVALQGKPPELRRLVEAVVGGSDLGGFACSALAEDERRRVRASLTAVAELGQAARQRQMKSAAAGERLRAIGEVAGLDVVAASFKPLGRSPRGLAQATIDLIPGVASWRPPHHVSPDGPRQRRTHQVVIWETAPAAQILESIATAPGLPALIVSASAMSLERRRQLEREARRRSLSFLFVDAYVLVHAAILNARDGIPPLEVLIATSMALGRTNPYTAAGPVHPEMFMGRRGEAEEVRDFGRAATVYGGRQLGKSALLRDIERAVNDPGDDRQPAVIRARYIDLKREGVGDRLEPDTIWPIIATSLRKAGIELFDGRRDRNAVIEGLELYLDEPLNELRLFLDEADDFLRRESETGFPNVYGLRQLVESHLDRFKVVFAGLHSVNRFRRIPNQPLAQLGNPVRIGPLKWDEARDLVVVPLEALGYRFDDEALVDLVLVETRRHPNLIQFACKRLIDHVSERAKEHGESAPLQITRDDLAEIFEGDAEFREWLRERFELTLNLYRHYKVLALILAMEAHNDDAVRIEGLQLRELEQLAREWWPEGFANMTPDEFTVVVEEMENLEVLAVNRETGRYRLPSVNLLRLLGGSDEIERHLLAELERPPEAEDEGAQHDRRVGDHGPSCLTYDDERRLFGPGQRRISLVLGNRALGGDRLDDDIADAATKPEWGDRPVVRRTLNILDPIPALEPRTVLVVRMRPTPRQMTEVAEGLQRIAQTDLSEDQRIVLTFGDDWMPRWLDLLDHVDMSEREQVQAIVLKRWNRGAFRRFLADLGANDERAAQWLVTTGGYPAAVDKLDGNTVADCDPEDRTRYAQLIADACGLERTPHARRVLRELAQGGIASPSELQELIGDGSLVEVDDATRLLTILGLARFERDGYVLNEFVPAAEIAGLT